MKKIITALTVLLLFLPFVTSIDVEFTQHTIKDGTGTDFAVVDFDSDGDYDILAESGFSVVLLENNGLMGFYDKVNISPATYLGIDDLKADDMNSDNDIDYIIADPVGASAIIGYNTGGIPFTFQEYILLDIGCTPRALDYGDVDLDSDIDFIVSCSNPPADEDIYYIENTCNETCDDLTLVTSPHWRKSSAPKTTSYWNPASARS